MYITVNDLSYLAGKETAESGCEVYEKQDGIMACMDLHGRMVVVVMVTGDGHHNIGR
jgi:hypothetical protein